MAKPGSVKGSEVGRVDGGRPEAEVIPGSGSKGRKVGIRILVCTIIDADRKNLRFFVGFSNYYLSTVGTDFFLNTYVPVTISYYIVGPFSVPDLT